MNELKSEESLAKADKSIQKADESIELGRKSIKRARVSIWLAIASIMLAIFALFLQICTTCRRENPYYSTGQPQIEMPQTVLTEDSCSKPKDDVVCQKNKICDL